MNNNDIYNDENIHTNDSVNSNKELISYTKNEISQEMDILSRSFDSVRLVNPFECCVTQIEDNKTDGTSLTNKCYDVWNAPYQCQNCTSARALITKQTQSKLDVVDNNIYQVTSRPVIVDGKALVLEIVKLFSYTYNRYNSSNSRKKLISAINAFNSQLLQDKETNSYNRDYLSEHLPNLICEAKKTHRSNTALINLRHLYDITQSEGSMAASGIICSLYSLLNQIFHDETDIDLLFVRYSPDTFFVLENKLDYKNFCERIELLPKKAAPEHILFNDKRLPFDIKTACADLGNENINTENELFDILKKRIDEIIDN